MSASDKRYSSSLSVPHPLPFEGGGNATLMDRSTSPSPLRGEGWGGGEPSTFKDPSTLEKPS